MAQGDYNVQNQSFPSFRSDLNSTLSAINSCNSGTSRPSSAVEGTIWLDVTSASTPTLKFFDGSDDISLATIDYSANTVNWLDNTVSFDIVNDGSPQLGGNLDVNGNSLVSTSNGNITFTPDGTGKVVISGLSFPTSDGSADQVLKTDGAGNLSFTDVSGGISWQSSIKTSSFTAVAGEGYWINTTSGAVTMTLPASASVGDTVEIVDYARTWGSNNVTINQNSLNFQGYSSPNPVYDVDGQSVRLVYSGSTNGWIPTSDDDVTDEVPQTYDIDYLVIAGGGGGGKDKAGGGGAGGLRNSFSSETSGGGGSSEAGFTSVSAGTVFTVTVGGGGAGSTNAFGEGTNGSTSSVAASGFTTVSSTGGGGGGSNNSPPGRDGGSGGGGAENTSGSGGSGTANQGFDGAAGVAGSSTAGGGGGAGSAGNTNRNGGSGLSSSITGSAVTYANGGDGEMTTGGATPTANLGIGGDGGYGGQNGDNGGSGVVILRVPTAKYSGTTTGSPTVTTDGTDTIMKFTGSGSYTS